MNFRGSFRNKENRFPLLLMRSRDFADPHVADMDLPAQKTFGKKAEQVFFEGSHSKLTNKSPHARSKLSSLHTSRASPCHSPTPPSLYAPLPPRTPGGVSLGATAVPNSGFEGLYPASMESLHPVSQ